MNWNEPEDDCSSHLDHANKFEDFYKQPSYIPFQNFWKKGRKNNIPCLSVSDF